MKVTIVTCTGDRPEAFSLCEKYMARQTRKPDQWFVLDDGEHPLAITPYSHAVGQTRISNPKWRGVSSMIAKLRWLFLESYQQIIGDVVFFIEDDDWYDPEYIDRVMSLFETSEKANATLTAYGEPYAYYFNIKHRWWLRHSNIRHASLCQTAVHLSALQTIQEILREQQNPFFDVALWARLLGSKTILSLRGDNHPLVIGIKGMPGRKGYGVGHKESPPKNSIEDTNLEKLGTLIPSEDVEIYRSYYLKPSTTIIPEVDLRTTAARAHGHGPVWVQHLWHLRDKEGALGMEIGSFQGDSAKWMLDWIFTAPLSHYICVDPFTGSAEHVRRAIDCSSNEKICREKLAPYGDRCSIHRMTSAEMLDWDQDLKESLDFLYIDGAHDAMNVLRDAVIGFRAVKHGGIIIFDDYRWLDMPREVDRPKIAIDAFLSCYADHIKVLNRGYQIVLEKR